jgi:hypothetical protein
LCGDMYLGFSLPRVFKTYNRDLHVYAIIAHVFFLFFFHGIQSNLPLLPLPSKPTDSLSLPCYILIIPLMAPVVQIEPNDSQALFFHDDAGEDLKSQGWDIFIKKFKGYNLLLAKEFFQTFDGYRENFGDVQLEVTEEFLSEATGLPLTG